MVVVQTSSLLQDRLLHSAAIPSGLASTADGVEEQAADHSRATQIIKGSGRKLIVPCKESGPGTGMR